MKKEPSDMMMIMVTLIISGAMIMLIAAIGGMDDGVSLQREPLFPASVKGKL